MTTSVQRLRNGLRRLIQLYAPTRVKQRLWSSEFESGHWDSLRLTPDDFIYPVIQRYSAGGGILDLGCGSGNTGVEIPSGAYSRYVGVDVSRAAIRMARARSEAAGRGALNSYHVCDIEHFEPDGAFRLILLRESIYYLRRSRLTSVLSRYSEHLEAGGVFVVRMYEHSGPNAEIVSILKNQFRVLAEDENPTGSLALVLEPRS